MTREPSPMSVLLWLLLLGALGVLLKVGQFIFLPLVIALLLCSAIQPLIDVLAKKKVPWWGTVSLVMIALVALLFLAGRVIYANARDYVATVDTAQVQAAAPDDLENALHDVLDDPARLTETVKGVVPKLTGYLIVAVSVMFGVLNQVGLVLLFMVFIFAEKQAFERKIGHAAGSKAPAVQRVIREIAHDVNRYLAIKTLLGLMTGVACCIALWILRVPYAPLFGLLAFLMNYIPNIGGIVATVPPMVAAFAHHGGWTTPILVFVLFTVINVLLGNVLEPRWLGSELDLSPLVILIALLFWTALWGFAGMVLAVPLTRTVQLVFGNIEALKPVAILMSNGEPVRSDDVAQ